MVRPSNRSQSNVTKSILTTSLLYSWDVGQQKDILRWPSQKRVRSGHALPHGQVLEKSVVLLQCTPQLVNVDLPCVDIITQSILIQGEGKSLASEKESIQHFFLIKQYFKSILLDMGPQKKEIKNRIKTNIRLVYLIMLHYNKAF